MRALILLLASVPTFHYQTAVPQYTLIPYPKTAPDSINLYDENQERIATCKLDEDMHASDCKIEKGHTLDDVMNAWIREYQKNR